MLKGIVLCGGIWAATATSVALVRYPQHTDEEPLGEDEVETLDPEDFISKKGEDALFASRYSSYFAAATEVNKKFWEDRFNKRSGGKGKIEVDQSSISKLKIVSALDNPEHKEGELSLVSFCREGYSSKPVLNNPEELDFSHASGTHLDLETSNLWSLCSVFDKKPETLCDNSDAKGKSSYSVGTIGREIHKSLVWTEDSHVFWDIREQEWRAIEVTDSIYFGEEKKKNSSIRDLCKDAYEKPAHSVDDSDIPSSITVAKYCRLEWTWD